MTGTYGADVSVPVTIDHWTYLRNLQTPVQAATVRCYEERSGGVIDPNCVSTLKNAKAAGIDSLSVYHFPSMKRGASAQTEASIAHLAGSGLTLDYYWLDVEPSDMAWWSDPKKNVGFIDEWYDAATRELAQYPTLKDTEVGFYTRAAHWPDITGNSRVFANTPLWFVYMFHENRDGPRSFKRFTEFGGWTEPTQVQWDLDVRFSPSKSQPRYDLNWAPATALSRRSGRGNKLKRTTRLVTYKVQQGDTFHGLVDKFGVTAAALAGINDIIDPELIARSPGLVIRIPPALGSDAGTITKKTAMEIIGHEGIVKEAYRGSREVWTWGVGLTNASGHHVSPTYIDAPASLERCLEVFEWALRTKYAPAVDEVFAGFELSEEQYAAALSFQFNTSGLRTARWVTDWKAGDEVAAYNAFTRKKVAERIPRLTKERDLFFDGVWASDGNAVCYPVRKPSYKPDFANAYQVDVDEILDKVLRAART